MKILTILLILISTTFAFAKSSNKTIDKSSALGSFLVELSGAAEGGASLAYFDTAYDFWQPSLEDCELITAEEAVKQSLDILSIVYNDSASNTEVSFPASAKSELEAFFGNDEYYFCEDNASVFMGINEFTRFISKDYNTRIQWTLGYED